MSILFFSATGANSEDGIFIPRTDLPGILANSELNSSESSATKLSKFLAAFLYKIHSTLVSNRQSTTSPQNLETGLGIDVTKSTPAGTGANRFTQTFLCTYAQVIDNAGKEIYPIPVPDTGDNEDKGQLLISSVFPNVSLLTSQDNIPEAGVFIPNSFLVGYGNGSTTDPVADMSSRTWFMAMFRALFALVPVRNIAGNIASAITTKAQTPVGNATLPANATALTNPTTGLDPEALSLLDIYSRAINFTIEYEINELTQTYDVRVA